MFHGIQIFSLQFQREFGLENSRVFRSSNFVFVTVVEFDETVTLEFTDKSETDRIIVEFYQVEKEIFVANLYLYSDPVDFR